MKRTEGQRALLKLNLSQARIARALRVKQSSVSLWMRALSRPEPPYRKALEILYGIPEVAWMTAAERAVVKRAQDAVAATGTDG